MKRNYEGQVDHASNPEVAMIAYQSATNLLIVLLSNLNSLIKALENFDTSSPKLRQIAHKLVNDENYRGSMVAILQKGQIPTELMELFSKRHEIGRHLKVVPGASETEGFIGTPSNESHY